MERVTVGPEVSKMRLGVTLRHGAIRIALGAEAANAVHIRGVKPAYAER